MAAGDGVEVLFADGTLLHLDRYSVIDLLEGRLPLCYVGRARSARPSSVSRSSGLLISRA